MSSSRSKQEKLTIYFFTQQILTKPGLSFNMSLNINSSSLIISSNTQEKTFFLYFRASNFIMKSSSVRNYFEQRPQEYI